METVLKYLQANLHEEILKNRTRFRRHEKERERESNIRNNLKEISVNMKSLIDLIQHRDY